MTFSRDSRGGKENEMANVYIFMADGAEEVEAMTQVDVLRRAGDRVTTVSIMDSKKILGAHDIMFHADAMFEDVDFSDGDLFVLPGGGVGTEHLENHEGLRRLLKKNYEAGKQVAAICAAPRYFGALGFLQGKKAVVYPGLEDRLTGAEVLQAAAVTDSNVTTGHGPGAAFDFALELVRVLHGDQKVKQLKEELVYPY
jgi:4-methyl-5(b-hydroxyethyl)-thiazole monophosphate biosynthesis